VAKQPKIHSELAETELLSEARLNPFKTAPNTSYKKMPGWFS